MLRHVRKEPTHERPLGRQCKAGSQNRTSYLCVGNAEGWPHVALGTSAVLPGSGRGESNATASARLPSMVSPPRSRSRAHLAHQRDPRVMSRGHFSAATSFATNDMTASAATHQSRLRADQWRTGEPGLAERRTVALASPAPQLGQFTQSEYESGQCRV